MSVRQAPNDAVNVQSNDEPEYEVIRGISQLFSAHMSALRIILCVCVWVSHNYYGYPSVDEVLYETIDPNKNSGEGVCSN